jgi:monoamine oxidase
MNMFGWFSKKVKWSERQPKVIVVGAGLSGLVASLKLAEAGVDLIVLDKEPQVGGRVYSEPLGGTHVNLGAQYFFECDNELLNRYISRVAKFKMERGLLGALWDGTLVASTDGEELFLKLPVEHKALEDLDTAGRKMAKERKELARKREFVFDKEPASQLWSDLDTMNGSEYLSEFHPDVEHFFNTMIIPEGGVGADKVSSLFLVGMYGGRETYSYLIEGGNQELTEVMAQDLTKEGGNLQLSTEVTEITNTETGVKVRTNKGDFDADYAIVTTPATVARKIISKLSPTKKQALEAVKYGASMQVGLHVSNFHSGKEPVQTCIFHHENINAYVDQVKEYQDNESVITLNVAGEESHRLDDDGIVNMVSETLKKMYPDFDPETSIIDYKIKKWTDGIVIYSPGFLSQYQETLRAKEGNIYFGGDYTHNPALDGAAWAGVRSAEQLLSAAKEKFVE